MTFLLYMVWTNKMANHRLNSAPQLRFCHPPKKHLSNMCTEPTCKLPSGGVPSKLINLIWTQCIMGGLWMQILITWNQLDYMQLMYHMLPSQYSKLLNVAANHQNPAPLHIAVALLLASNALPSVPVMGIIIVQTNKHLRLSGNMKNMMLVQKYLRRKLNRL